MTDTAHLPTAALEGYLRNALLPSHRQQVRTHLDACKACWTAWNRHRWDAASTDPLYSQLAEFLGADFQPYFDSSQALAREWATANPRTEHETAQFFRTSTSYLYNLTIWQASGNRPAYVPLALPTLIRRGSRTILDYGCGIGNDSIPLRQSGFDVVGCDFHSPSTAFLRWRSDGTIPVIEPNELDTLAAPDTLWIIDTLDHVVDIDTSLRTVLAVVDLVVTENLTANRGHGRQGFHIRRPFTELTALFARFGLRPNSTSKNDPVMFWTRVR
ncbi:methyltransferase domain-containing protein [Amycolatopsis pigmentata]|uniref:Methyltransferase domain-containing protein n=1 Tax=Amycolatopsis pigmentata TaxID=450801 RepID=A0ABW5G5M0_9PSEU